MRSHRIILVVVIFGCALAGSLLAVSANDLFQPEDVRSSAPAAKQACTRLVAGCWKQDTTTADSCTRLRTGTAQPAAFHKCYGQALGNLAYERGPSAALRQLEADRASDRDGAITTGCHVITHVIGAAALARTRGDAGRAFAEGSSICAGGYYHGVLLRVLLPIPTQEIGSAAAKVCNETATSSRGADRYLTAKCRHGIGHALLIHLGNENLPTALRECDRNRASGAARLCHEGVFMENLSIFTGSGGGLTPWVRSDDPSYPCTVVQQQYRDACWMRQGYLLVQLPGRIRAGADVCGRAEPRYRESCVWSLSIALTSNNAGEPRSVLHNCRQMQTEQFAQCIEAAAAFVSDSNSTKAAARICAEAPPATASVCYRGIGSSIATSADGVADARIRCAAVTPTGLLGACMASARTFLGDASSRRAPSVMDSGAA